MTPRKLATILGWILFVGVSFAIQYEVKVGLHRHAGTVRSLGHVSLQQPALDFSLPGLDGKTNTLSSYRGTNVVLLDFWATWCPPCRLTMPDLQDLHDKLKDRGLKILSLNQGELRDAVEPFIRKKKYTFRVLLDQSEAVGSAYGVTAIPTLVVIDKKGIIREIHVGRPNDESELRDHIEAMLKE